MDDHFPLSTDLKQTKKKAKTRDKVDHINYPLVPENWFSDPLYDMHKYWARKPPENVSTYIKRYSKENEIILDPFCGSGVVAFESMKNNRRFIGTDLNPISIFLIEVTLKQINISELEKEFFDFEKKIKDKVNLLYTINCLHCEKKSALLINVVWSYRVKCPLCNKILIMNNLRRPKEKRQNIYTCSECNKNFSYGNVDILDEVPIRILYTCHNCGRRENTINENTIVSPIINKEFWYPQITFAYENKKSFLTRRRAKNILGLFTKRSLYALSIIFQHILEIKNEDIKNIFLLTFSSTIPQTSRLMIWTKDSGPSWKIPEYIVYPTHCELNVWDRFINRYKKIHKGKKYTNEKLQSYNRANAFQQLLKNKNILFNCGTALDLTKIPDNSIDYVFTDPPYGGAVQYYELDVVRLAWLNKYNEKKFNLDWWKEEITINEHQGKNFDQYHNMLSSAFSQIFQKLKPNRYMTVTFHHTDIEVYNSIIRAAVIAGFITEYIIYQMPSSPSVKQQAQPYGSALGDYYIRFRKPLVKRERFDTLTADLVDRSEKIIIEAVKTIIAERGQPTTYTDLLRRIYIELDKAGFLLISKPLQIQQIIKKYEGTELVFLKDKGWWFKDPSKYWLHLIPLYDRVENAVVQVLRRSGRVSFDHILREIFMTYRNALTPSPSDVMEILKEYAQQTSDGKWLIKQKVVHGYTIHSSIIYKLAEIGKKANYKIWIGKREQRDLFDNKPLIDLCDLTNLYSLDINPDNLAFVENIDLLWINNNKIDYAFEIENTTAITEAINRFSNIPHNHNLNKVIVIPKDRESFLYRKMKSEFLKSRFQTDPWHFIYYEDLFQLYEIISIKKKTDVSIIEKILKIPENIQIQETLDPHF